MEEIVTKFKNLLKTSLERLKNDSIDLSVIDEYSPEEVFDEIKFLLEGLITYKESHKSAPILKDISKGNPQSSHIHLIDLSSEKEITKINSDLKNKLKEIQQKYISKVSKLLNVEKITITPMPFGRTLNSTGKVHIRKPSSFKSLNSRHPGSERNHEEHVKNLKSALKNAGNNGIRKKSNHYRCPTEFILC